MRYMFQWYQGISPGKRYDLNQLFHLLRNLQGSSTNDLFKQGANSINSIIRKTQKSRS